MAKKEISPETIAFIEAHAGDNVQTLALQAARYPKVNMSVAIMQIAARQTARSKMPTWWETNGLRYPQHLSMEQCSSEVTARYKSGLIPEPLKRDGCLTDLTGGFGVDFACMAKGFVGATYVERQEELCALAEHNLPLLGLPHAQVVHANAVEYLKDMSKQAVIYVDPSRRDLKGRKTVAINDCEPNIAQLNGQLMEKAEMVIVKLSPMLDISLALEVLPNVREVHVVAVGGECKELLLILDAQARSVEARVVCVNLPTIVNGICPKPFVFFRHEEENVEYQTATALEDYLYEPSTSLLKAGAFRTVASRYNLKKLHPNSHLYTSERLLPDFPGRVFRIIEQGGFGKRDVKRIQAITSKANITVRNFPTSVMKLRKQLKLAEGGELYLFATTLADDDKQWILCRKPMMQES